MGQSRPSFLRMYSLYRLKRFQGFFCFSWFTDCLRIVFYECFVDICLTTFRQFRSCSEWPWNLHGQLAVRSELQQRTHFKSFVEHLEMALRTCIRGENLNNLMRRATYFRRLTLTTPRSISRLSQTGDHDTERDARERSRSVTSFYFQSAIDQAAAKVRIFFPDLQCQSLVVCCARLSMINVL